MPKPLINVLGRPMYSWAADGLPLDKAHQIIFICLGEHLAACNLEADIHQRYGRYNPRIVPVESVTRGQACTVLLARESIDNDEPLLIFNADTYCPTTLTAALDRYDPPADGVLDVFEVAGDRWSFVRCDPSGRVVETAEKRRISNLASTGLYYFRRGSDFVRHADAAIAAEETTGGEFYVAPLYNRLVAAGAQVRANQVNEVWALGTPEDLDRFQREYKP
jgi:NDP-sugar pyrophosphorylase family protein